MIDYNKHTRKRDAILMTHQEMYYKKMTQTPIPRLIITLGIPTTISMLITNIYNMVDTYFVGTLGESQQAATGVLFTLQAIIQAIAFMLGQGSGTMVSKELADKNQKGASKYESSAFFVGAAAGILLAVLGLVFLNPFLRILGSTETIIPYARQYGLCILVACPFMICSFVLNNNLRYEGMAFYAMIGLTIGGVLNIFGDYLLIRIIPLGVLGAGISTAASQMIGFCLLLYFHRKKAQGKISLVHISLQKETYFTVMRVGFPALIRQGLASVSNGLLNNLTKPFGDAAIAAMSIVNRFSAFMMCVGLGIGQGLQPVASFNYQAKKYARVKKALVFTMIAGFLMVGAIAAVSLIYTKEIVLLFQKSKDVLKIAVFALRCAIVGTMFLPLSVPINMLYQSIRKAAMSTVLSLLRSGLAFIPVLLLTTKLWGITGIQISQPLADVITGIISIGFIIYFMFTTSNEGE